MPCAANDPAEVARYPLRFQPYAIARLAGDGFRDERRAARGAAATGGIAPSRYARAVRGLEGCLAYHAELEAQRAELPFELDGVVCKLDRLDLRERLGATARATRWQFAFKFAPNEATSVAARDRGPGRGPSDD